MRLYLDTCCYRRPFDDLSDSRARRETKAIGDILAACRKSGDCTILGSWAVRTEIDKIRRAKKRAKTICFYNSTVTKRNEKNDPVVEERIKVLAKQHGMSGLDIQHLALAVALNADFLLTTDDDFVMACLNMDLNVKVENPREFLRKRYIVSKTFRSTNVREITAAAEPDIDVDFHAWFEWLIGDDGEGDCVKEKHEAPPATEEDMEFFDMLGKIDAAYAKVCDQNGGDYSDSREWLALSELDDMREEVKRMGIDRTVEFLRNDPKGQLMRMHIHCNAVA